MPSRLGTLLKGLCFWPTFFVSTDIFPAAPSDSACLRFQGVVCQPLLGYGHTVWDGISYLNPESKMECSTESPQ